MLGNHPRAENRNPETRHRKVEEPSKQPYFGGRVKSQQPPPSLEKESHTKKEN